MRKLGFAIGLVAVCCLVVNAGTLQLKPMGKPFHAQKVQATPIVTQPATMERIWQLVDLGTIDLNGQVVSPSSRQNTVIYDNTLNDTGYLTTFPVADQAGDTLRMINGGTLQSISLSIFNGDATNKMLTAKIKVVFYSLTTVVPGTGLPPVVVGSFTTSTAVDFQPAYPGGMPQYAGVTVTINASASGIVLPQLVYAGCILKEVTGTPGVPTTWGQGLISPPTIGTDWPWFWGYTLDGTGVFTGNYGFQNNTPPGDMYYEVEVDPVASVPQPIYANTTNTANYGTTDVANVIMSDELDMVPFPAGENLDRIEFTIFNGSATDTLNTVDLDIVLREWNPVSMDYFGEAAATSWVISLTGNTVDLPPSYAAGYYVSGLATQAAIQFGSAAWCDVLAGIRFYNMAPVAVTDVGQLLYAPPTVGGSDDRFKVEGGPYGVGGWYFFNGFLQSNFYWGFATAAPYQVGDMNCDGAINGQDIDGFILVLFGAPPYASYYAWTGIVNPPCNAYLGDMNGDGNVNGQDIDGFVAALFGK